MDNEPFIVITDDDPPAPPPGPPGTRWGYAFWQAVEDRARQREARNATLRVLKELSTRVPHSPHFRRTMDPTVPDELQTWPVDLMR